MRGDLFADRTSFGSKRHVPSLGMRFVFEEGSSWLDAQSLRPRVWKRVASNHAAANTAPAFHNLTLNLLHYPASQDLL